MSENHESKLMLGGKSFPGWSSSELISKRQYVLQSERGPVQLTAADRNAYLTSHRWDDYFACAPSPRAWPIRR